MKYICTILVSLILVYDGVTQTAIDSVSAMKKAAPNYSIFRANDNFRYLKNIDDNPFLSDFFDPVKFIALNTQRSAYLTLGGEVRPRFEYFENRKWKKESVSYYSQRISFHSNIQLGEKFRIFTELYHGYTSHVKQLPQYDKIDFHQLFLEFELNLGENKKMSFILGRQEMKFGTSRLVTLREGPNIRQDFDLIRSIIKLSNTTFQFFYGKEVRTQTEAFDNAFTLFDAMAPNATLWGLYAQFKIKGIPGKNELYYLGSYSDMKSFSDVDGEETRHTVGIRRFGMMGDRWRYNTEFIYQFGDNDGNTISAYNIEADWSYTISKGKWNPTPGLKLVYTSGDRVVGDGKLNTFNPLYVSPNVYNLSSTIIPINVISFHPNIRLKPTKKWKLIVEYVLFWRSSLADGVYSPPGVVSRPADSSGSRRLGGQFALDVTYSFDRHWSINLGTSYYLAGAFQKATPDSENIFHIAPTISYKF